MIKSLIALIVIPIIGYLVSLGILNSLAEDKSISEFVEFVKFNCQSGINICDMLEKVILLRDGSFYSFIFSFFIIFSFFLVSKLIGTNRNLIARVFPPLLHLFLIMVSIQTIVQGVILTYGFYIGEVFFLGMVHFIQEISS